MDFRAARRCINRMKRRGIYYGERIGVVTKEIPCLSHYPAGTVCLFRSGLKSSEVTVEKPMPYEVLRKRQIRSLTWGTIVCVPAEYVTEVRL